MEIILQSAALVLTTLLCLILSPIALRLYRSSTRDQGGLGLHVVFDPAEHGQRVNFDLIAVHGLGAHPEHTWSAWSPQTGSRIYWLKEYLPRKLPNTRVLTFGYNASWVYNAPIKTTKGIGKTLLDEINKLDDGKETRPRIFLAHSLGGVVVKQAFVSAQLKDAYAKISASFAGIVFLGTPHRGSPLAFPVAVFTRLVASILGSNDLLLKSLTKHNIELADFHDDFIGAWSSKHRGRRLYCFTETLQTRQLHIPVGEIVDVTSGRLDIATNDVMNKDHSGLNKFTTENVDFKQLCKRIKEAYHSAVASGIRPSLIRSIVQKAQKHPYTLEDFVVPRSEAREKDEISLFEKSTEYLSSLSWENRSSRFLWFRSGSRLSGPSHVEHLARAEEQVTEDCVDNTTEYLYAPCEWLAARDSNDIELSSRILQSLILQLVLKGTSQMQQIEDRMQHLLAKSVDASLRLHPSEYWRVLERLLSRRSNPVCIVIDGLDYIVEETARTIFGRELRRFWSEMEASKSNLKALVSGRPYAWLLACLKGIKAFDPHGEYLSCLEMLSHGAPNKRVEKVAKADEGTGTWFDSVAGYQSWKQELGSRLFCLWGAAGTGKSTLLKRIRDSLQKECYAPPLSRMLRRKTEDDEHSHTRTDRANHGKLNDAIVTSYFFSRGSTTERVPARLLQSLLFQILHQRSDAFEAVRGCIQEWKNGEESSQDMTAMNANDTTWPSALGKALFNLQRSETHSFRVYVFIDAVDELDRPAAEAMVRYFRELCSQTASKVIFKVMIASQLVDMRSQPTHSAPEAIFLERHNGKDISQVVVGRMVRIRERIDAFPLEDRKRFRVDDFQKGLLERVKGVMLWAQLVLNYVELELEFGNLTNQGMMAQLDAQQPDLTERYAAIVKRLRSQNAVEQDKSRDWLLWGTLRDWDLTMREFYDAVALSPSAHLQVFTLPELLDRRLPSSVAHIQGALVRTCGGFLVAHVLQDAATASITEKAARIVNGECAVVRVLHQTVRGFLEKDEAHPFQIQRKRQAQVILLAGVNYVRVTFQPYEGVPASRIIAWEAEDYGDMVLRLNQLPLLNFTIASLPSYHEAIGTRTREPDSPFQKLRAELEARKNFVACYFLHAWCLTAAEKRDSDLRGFWAHEATLSLSWMSPSQRDHFHAFMYGALVAATKAGLANVVRVLLLAGALTVVADTRRLYDRCMNIAAGRDHGIIIIDLHRAFVENESLPMKTQRWHSLSKNSESPSTSTSDTESDDSEAQPDSSARPHTWSKSRGGGTDVHRGDRSLDQTHTDSGSGWTPLHYAADAGSIEAMRALYNTDQKCEMLDIADSTPLHYAALNGHVEAVQFLLTKGADSNAQNQAGQSPLAMAAAEGHLAAVRAIVEGGAEVNARDNRGRPIITIASENGHTGTAQLLLDMGADPKAIMIPPGKFLMVPMPRPPNFTGRENYLTQMHSILTSRAAGKLILIGLGGVGKTLLAVEHSYRSWELQSPRPSIFWVDCSSTSHVASSYAYIAEIAKLPGREDPLMHSSIVRGWLEGSESGPWLLILDNLDEESTASEVVSSLLSGSDITRGDHLRQILVTTRNATIVDIPTPTFEILHIDRLQDEEGIELLDRILGKRSSRLEILRQLLQYLDGLPLAIAQAAAFMRQVKMNAAEYLALYKENEENAVQLLDYEFVNLQRQPSAANAVTRTLELSFAQVRARNAPAADLLSLLSVLATGSVPIWILGMKSKEENDHRIEEAIEVLVSYSLIQLGQDRSLYLHTLVQRATRSWLARGSELERWKSAALRVVSTKFPEPDFGNWSKCRELLVHAERVVEYPAKDEVTHIELLYKLGRYNLGSGDYFRAEQQIEHAYSNSIQTHGETNEQTLLILSDLISCKLATGKWTDAENLGSYALQMAKETLVKNDPAMLTIMTTLAEVWTRQGRWTKAENLESHALEAKHRVLGDEHPSTLSAMNNLAAVYKNQGRLNEAESLENQVLQLRKRVLGNEHPDTLVSLNNLAIIYLDMGRYYDSEQLLRQVIDLRRRLLGPEHPDTVHSMHNLAIIYGSQGRLNEAEQLMTEVLELIKRILGPEHPRTLDSIRNLAMIYKSQGRLNEAEELMIKVLKLTKRMLGSKHPRTLDSIRNLAMIYKSQRRLKEAEELSTEALELTKTKLR